MEGDIRNVTIELRCCFDIHGDGGRILANGDRVLNMTARSKTIAEVQKQPYEETDLINRPEGFWQHNIGWRVVR